MHLKARLLLLIIFCCGALYAANDVYKYKDQSGNWVFTDKAPSGTKKLENIKVAQTQVSLPAPKVYGEVIAGRFYLFAENFIHAPVQIEVRSPSNAGKKINYVLDAKELATLHEGSQELKNLKVSWILGEPNTKPINYLYQVPIKSNQKFPISQGFGGEFSHFNAHSKFAIDISMDIGTDISAARAGTVMWVKDDSYVGGSDPSYMSKANFVAVVHDDGTYATYLHLLGGSSYVQAGDKIEAGDRLGKSGASGFVTGPHLHFVVQRNANGKTVSLPFQFAANNGKGITPARGLKLSGTLATRPGNKFAQGNGYADLQSGQEINPAKQTIKKLNNDKCEKARIDYIILAQDTPVYRDHNNQLRAQSAIDYYSGEHTILDEAQRTAETEKAKVKIVNSCANPNDNKALHEASKKWLRQEHCANARHAVELLEKPDALTPNDILKRKRQKANDICSGKTRLLN